MSKSKIKGFSLLEILLVLAIVSSLVILMLNYSTQKTNELRRDKAAVQLQQILNAALGFYANHSYWPLKGATITNTLCAKTSITPEWTDLSALQATSNSYLPANFKTNPYNQYFVVTCNAVNGFYVRTTVDTASNALVIAGKLPLAYVTTPESISNAPPYQSPSCTNPSSAAFKDCTAVVAGVTMPGQNLNNARSINYAGFFYSGSCVPAPICPPGMKPDIIVSVGSVSGVYDDPACSGAAKNYPYDPTPGCTAKVYPVSSFSAFARGDTSGNPTLPSPGPLDCQTATSGSQQMCWRSYEQGGVPTTFPSDGTKYWRVCLAVITERGQVSFNSSSDFTQKGKMMGNVVAFTRCVPNAGNENPGGSINVYQQNTNFNP